jgi:dihydropteroate synthase
MGILNVTPDSFSDGGRFLDTDAAIARGLAMLAEGADVLDIGGESTRPGSQPVAADEELRRVLPVVRGLVDSGKLGERLLSIDTSKADVVEQCLEAGAHVVNDVTALRGDPRMAEVARTFGAGVILMHMKGTPQTMQIDPRYDDVVGEVRDFLEERLHVCANMGIADSCVLDPGVGFGKTHEHNWALSANLDAVAALGRPVCLGVSRKGFIGKLLGREVGERMIGSLAVALDAAFRGSAHLLRVHDVAATSDALRVMAKLTEHRGKRF